MHEWEAKDSSLYILKEGHFNTVFGTDKSEVHSRNAEKCVFIEFTVLSNKTYIARLYSMAYKSIDLCVLLSGVTFILTLISVSLRHCIMHSQCHLSAPLRSECLLLLSRCTDALCSLQFKTSVSKPIYSHMHPPFKIIPRTYHALTLQSKVNIQ